MVQTHSRAVHYAEFQEEMRRRGGGGPDGKGPDLFRIFREKAESCRIKAKKILRPSLPADQSLTPERILFDRIETGGIVGTLTAARVLLMHHTKRHNI